MSYILDALKKSDRDRDRHRQAPLAPITGTPEFRAGRRTGAGRFRLLGVAVLLVGAAWGGFGLARLEPRLDSRTNPLEDDRAFAVVQAWSALYD